MKILKHIIGAILFYVGFLGACSALIPFGMMDPGLLWIQIYGATAFIGSIGIFVIGGSALAIFERFWTP